MTIINKVVMVVDDQERILETSEALPGWGRDDLLRASLWDVIDCDEQKVCRLQTARGRPIVNIDMRPLPGSLHFVEIISRH